MKCDIYETRNTKVFSLWMNIVVKIIASIVEFLHKALLIPSATGVNYVEVLNALDVVPVYSDKICI